MLATIAAASIPVRFHGIFCSSVMRKYGFANVCFGSKAAAQNSLDISI